MNLCNWGLPARHKMAHTVGTGLDVGTAEVMVDMQSSR